MSHVRHTWNQTHNINLNNGHQKTDLFLLLWQSKAELRLNGKSHMKHPVYSRHDHNVAARYKTCIVSKVSLSGEIFHKGHICYSFQVSETSENVHCNKQFTKTDQVLTEVKILSYVADFCGLQRFNVSQILTYKQLQTATIRLRPTSSSRIKN